MGFGWPRIVNSMQFLRRSSDSAVRNGCCAVYVGEGQKKRYVIPIAYLNEPMFQDLLSQAEDEFGYDHPMGGITIPCRDDLFVDLISGLNQS